MPLQSGTKLGQYEILDPIGAGGMGEVYRARDTKLEREVEIKVLPEELSQDRERLARFEREAKLLASLNHPAIATLHGFEDGFLVMELVEGETLGERIGKGAVSVDEALPLFIQIAEGLEAAHEKGVIHRDLKPANIKITPDGKVKILDFGLAKAFAPQESEVDDSSRSPTLTKGTALGAIMGTASYMSPEQARGKPVDKRTDIWAFGCCLYEALTGKKAFEGDTVTDTLSAVVRAEPDWTALPPAISARLRELLERCLRKDARRRVHDIADARLELEESEERIDATIPAPSIRKWPAMLSVGVAGVLVGLGTALLLDGTREPSPATLRFTMNAAPSIDRVGNPTISPDGERIVYVGHQGENTRLFLRELDKMEAAAIPGTEGALLPFFSPDGLWIGYFAGDEIQKVSVLGGESTTVCKASSNMPGARWGVDDTIVFSPDWTSGLMRVAGSGGEPEVLTTLDRDAGEVGHWWPEFLPDGRTVLFTVWTGGDLNEARIAAVDLETGERRTLFQGARSRYASSGHVVFYRAGRYQAMAFDVSRLEPTSEPRPVLANTRREAPQGANDTFFDFSRGGTLVSIPGEDYADRSSLVWIYRDGTREPLPFDEAVFTRAQVSPDGKRIAASQILAGSYDIWIYDLERGLEERLTREASNFKPVWHPSGQRIAFGSTRGGSFNVYQKELASSAPVQPLLEGPLDETPYSWSSDGSLLAITEWTPERGQDVLLVEMEDPSRKKRLVQTPFSDTTPDISPNGNWVAFSSSLSGRYEVYVQSVHDSGGRVRISTDGGVEPLWSPTANELYFRNRDQAMVVRYETDGNVLAAGTPSVLFDMPSKPVLSASEQVSWDIAPDGDRFLVLEPLPDSPPRDQIHVTTNWFEELKRLVPTN